MNKHLKTMLATILVLNGIVASTLVAFAAPANTIGEIGFTLDSGTPEIILPDPDTENPSTPNPENPGTPEDGNSGNAGDAFLRIDHVSNFRFGINSIDMINGGTFNALAQEWRNNTEETNITGHTVPFIQITDVRGTHAGWNLTVAQTAQFAATLDGTPVNLGASQLTLLNTRVTNSTDTNVTVPATSTLVPGGSAISILNAPANHGMGTTQLLFGNATLLEGDRTDGIKLEVPANTAVAANVTYTTALVWTLSNTP